MSTRATLRDTQPDSKSSAACPRVRDRRYDPLARRLIFSKMSWYPMCFS